MNRSAQRKLGLGIDTGGTFTDAAVLDLNTQKLLAKAKSPTTHQELSVGILGAVDEVLACSEFTIQEICLVGISTTLATNSILEGRGSEVGLIGIGWRPDGRQELGAKSCAFVQGSFDTRGREVEPLDEQEVAEAVDRMAPEVEAFAVSGLFGVLNPSHEERVREIIRSHTNLPVVVGHELTVELGIAERSVTAVLNARLLPVIEDFMDGVEGALRLRNLHAPIMVYKGDGSLMSVEKAKTRPVETILSGPAASLQGGRVLSGLDDCIVLDIGGTSTDIAFMDEGFPRLSRSGATVGRWRTKVRATDVWTAALGGDSRIALVDGRIVFGPERVVPLGVATEHHPRLLHKMQVSRRLEYLIAYQRDVAKLTEEERQVHKLLTEKGPMTAEEVVKALPDIYLPRTFASDLKAKGHATATGLTPTDLLNVSGMFSRGSRIGAELATEIFASTYGFDKQDFTRDALGLIGSRMAEELLLKMVEDGSGSPLQGKGGEYLLDMLTGARKGDLELTARLSRPIVGIGAPALFFVPSLERLLHTKVVVPPNHDVGNAVGAICSQVFDSVTIQIHSRDGQYNLITPFSEPLRFDRLEEAIERGSAMAEEHVIEQVRSSGGVEVVTKVEVRDMRARTGSHGRSDRLNWIEIKARATGVPDVLRSE
jgi:N-methylhydantoinase A/oxoprolinase/acetone carboxylase beta subunit